jgi:hypothetical protein
MNRHIKATLITGTILLWAATATAGTTLSATNGVYTAKPGVECTTRENAWAALWFHDFDMAKRMILSRDIDAFMKMEKDRRVIELKTGLPVIIETRHEARVEVRPKGQTFTLWMSPVWVECPVASTPNPNAAAKRR